LSSKYKTIDEHEAICSRKPINIINNNNNNNDIDMNDDIDKNNNNNNITIDNNNNNNNITIDNNNYSDDDDNNNNDITRTEPSLIELFLLKKLKSKQKNIQNFKRGDINHSKLMKDWKSISHEIKSKISIKIKNGNHIRKKSLLQVKNHNNGNNDNKIKNLKYELNINDFKRKNDYLPKSDNECEVDSLFIDGTNNNNNNNIEKQKNIVKKLLNSMTLIPDNDDFVLNNFKQENVMETNKNIEILKSKLNNFLNM
jgi:hypothetical protein